LPVGDPLLHRYERIVGDLDVFRADLGTAFGDIAVAEPLFVLGEFPAVRSIQRMHFQFRDPHQITRPGKGLLVFLVITHHMTYVLAQEAFDALTELLRTPDIDLTHPVIPWPQIRRWGEGRYLPGFLVIERDIRYQISDHRERPHRRHSDDFVLMEG